MNGHSVGYPENSTLGFMLGFRATSQKLGQINLWPMMPGEEGIYSCEVTMIVDNLGSTIVKKKTFGVFVSE